MRAVERWHPAVLLAYFGALVGLTMAMRNLTGLAVSFFGALVCYGVLAGARHAAASLAAALPLLALVTLLNPLFARAGLTVLFYLGDRPVTLEALVSGLAAGLMLAAAFCWFLALGEALDSDRLIYLFGRVAPAFALTLSMALRMVPRLRREAGVIRDAQRARGLDPLGGSWPARLKGGLRTASILLTWALENGVDTADSMRARGYGLRKKTGYAPYRFRAADGVLLAVIFSLAVWPALLLRGGRFYPVLPELFPRGTLPGALSLLALSLLPVILEGWEAIRWRYSLSKL